jgi:hypothetical protein
MSIVNGQGTPAIDHSAMPLLHSEAVVKYVQSSLHEAKKFVDEGGVPDRMKPNSPSMRNVDLRDAMVSPVVIECEI